MFMPHKLSMAKKLSNSKAFAILIGKEGSGKTTIFSKVTNASSRQDLFHCCSCKSGQSYNEHCDLQIIDPNTNGCSLLHGLTYCKLNCIFVLIEFHPRVGSIMIDSFWEAVSCLRYDDLSMVVILVTKMDRYKPGDAWPSVQCIERDIRKLFEQEVEVGRVIFSHPDMTKRDLINSMFTQVKDMPLRQLAYKDFEIIEHFGLAMACVPQASSHDGTLASKKRPFVLDDMIYSEQSKVRKLATADVNSVQLKLSTSSQNNVNINGSVIPKTDSTTHQSKKHQELENVKNPNTQRKAYKQKLNGAKYKCLEIPIPKHIHEGNIQQQKKTESIDGFCEVTYQGPLNRINYDADSHQVNVSCFDRFSVIFREAATMVRNMRSRFFGGNNG